MLLFQGARPSFSTIQYNWQYNSFICINFSFLESRQDDKICQVNNNKHFPCLFCISFLHECHLYLLPLLSDICTFPHFQMINFQLLYFDFVLYFGGETDHYLVFSEFTYKPMSLLAFMKISVFSLMVCKLSPNILTSSA